MFCRADEFANGRTICGRCRLEWATGAAPDAIPACKPKAAPPIESAEMTDVLRRAAEDTMASQRALIAGRFRVLPHDGEMRRAAVLRAAAELIERVAADATIVERLRREG